MMSCCELAEKGALKARLIFIRGLSVFSAADYERSDRLSSQAMSTSSVSAPTGLGNLAISFVL